MAVVGTFVDLLLRKHGSIAERVLRGCLLGLSLVRVVGGSEHVAKALAVVAGQVWEELGNRTKAESGSGGGCSSARSDRLPVALGTETVDRRRCRCSDEATLLVVLLEAALCLLATPAEEDQTKDKGETEDDSHGETSLCAPRHSSLFALRRGATATGFYGSKRSGADHTRGAVGELGVASRRSVSSLNG